ncbi:MAG TPA: DUF481 domain-containing protein [Rudaea sp.]|nr:DUF481 domain-containing protein [Rudaea sp.]
MKHALLVTTLAFALPLASHAADAPAPKQGWSGSGEAGLAIASGNTESENLNAKVDIKYNDAQWKDDYYVKALRNKADVTTTAVDGTKSTQYRLTAERYETGASSGYKLDDRSYVVGAVRYEHDGFSPYAYQYIGTLGYGYQALKSAHDELAFEIGGGYKGAQPGPTYVANPNPPPAQIKLQLAADGAAAERGKADYKHTFNASTSFTDTVLVESAGSDTFVQNDAGVNVKMTSKLALKAGYEVRYNSAVQAGFKKTDQLATTNLVYSF